MATPDNKIVPPVGNQPKEVTAPTDSFGISNEFAIAQQAKRAAKQAAAISNPTPAPAPAPANPVPAGQGISAEAPAVPIIETPAPTIIETPPANVEQAPIKTNPVQEIPKPQNFNEATKVAEMNAKLEEVKKNEAQNAINSATEASKADPSLLTDRNKFNAATGYQYKTSEGQALLDQYFQSHIPKTASDIRKQLQAGVALTDAKLLNSPAYRQAKFDQDRFQRFNSMNSEQLFNELKANNLPSSVQNELMQNPAFVEAKAKEAEYMKTKNVNDSLKSFMGTKTEERDPLTVLSDGLRSLFADDSTGTTAQEFRQYVSQNPEITGPTAEYNKKYAEKRELERARDQLTADLKQKFRGEPISTILAMAAQQSEPLNNQINTLNDSLNLLYSDIKSKTDFATSEFGYAQKDKEASAAKQEKLNEILGNLAVSEYKTAGERAFETQKLELQNKYQSDRDTENYVRDLNKLGIQNVYDLEKRADDREFQKELLALNQKYENSRSVRDFQNDLRKLSFQSTLQNESKALDLQNSMALEEYRASLDPDKAEKWQALMDTAKENSSLADLYGKNVGTYEGNRGYDLAGKLGDAIVSPPGAQIVEAWSLNPDGTVSKFSAGPNPGDKVVGTSVRDPGYGNSVVLKLPDGKYMRLSHLQEIVGNVGDTFSGGQLIGTRGNTGNVLGRNGEKLTDAQKAAGRGAHVDVEISNDRSFDKNNLLSQGDQLAYLKSIKPFQNGKKSAELTDADIETFNNPTFKPADIKKADQKARYEQYVNEKNRIKTEKDVSINDILRFSAGGRDLGAEEAKSLSKYDQALGQIAGLQQGIRDIDSGPVLGKLRSLNPYDTDVQVLKAQLNSLIPNLARGVYGEVGVLTDQDIQNYAKTIPNLTSTSDVNKAVLAMTLDTIAGGYKKQLRTLAASGRDVSGFVSLYDEIKSQADALKADLSGGSQTNGGTGSLPGLTTNYNLNFLR